MRNLHEPCALDPFNVDVRLIAAVQTHAGARCHEAANVLGSYAPWRRCTVWP